MTNAERIQAHNADLRECIELAEGLPDAGSSGEDYLASRFNNTLTVYKSDEVKQLPNYAFYGCTSIERISCPSCSSIATAPFQNCTSLRRIDFPSCTDIGGTVFRGCSVLSSVNMPLLKTSSTYSFAQCYALKEISFPEILTLGGAMFQDCTALETAYIPKATSIGAMTFQRCTLLAKVVIEQNERVCALAAVTAFEGTLIASGNGSIYVPNNRVEEYKNTTNWSAYADQIKPLSELG